jgi:hypothetical protein
MNMSYDEFKALQEKIDAISRDEPLPQVNEDSVDNDKFDQLNNIFMSLESLKADVGELQDLDNTEGATGSGDLHDQIATMDKLIEQFYEVIDRATSIVPHQDVNPLDGFS